MRRGNVIRLPLPDPTTAKDPAKMFEHVANLTNLLNQSLQSVQNRLNTIQQVGAKPPVNVTGFSVAGQQGCFYLTWNRVANVDGYVITQYSGSNTNTQIGRYTLPDGDSCSYAVPVGNIAVTATFRVYAYQGPQIGLPSNAITATTVVYSTSSHDTAPANPPKAPREPKLAPPRSGLTLP